MSHPPVPTPRLSTVPHVSSLLSRTVHGALVLVRAPARRRRRDEAPVFCFHNVVGRGRAPVGDASLHMDAGHFERLLAWITATYEVIPLAALSDRLAQGRPMRGLAALTFDDGCRGVYRHAAPLLRARALPATVFVVPEAVESGRHYWWDRLAGAAALDTATRTRCLDELRGEEAAVDRAVSPDEADLPDDLRPAPWTTLREGEAHGLALASHTLTHPNLTRLAPDEVERELVGSARTLEARTGRPPTHLAYPYGRVSARVAEAARAAGYRAAWTLDSRPAGPGVDPLLAPRINVPAGIAPTVLECWAAGIRLR